MVPRSEIIAVDYYQSYYEILDVIKEESHSRMPVYKKNLDNVVGFFHIKDFMKADQKDFNINNILRGNICSPKSPILDFLKTMRSSKFILAQGRWSRRGRRSCNYRRPCRRNCW